MQGAGDIAAACGAHTWSRSGRIWTLCKNAICSSCAGREPSRGSSSHTSGLDVSILSHKITIGGYEMVAYMQPQLNFSTVVNLLGNSTSDKSLVTEWIQEAIELILGHKAIQSSRRKVYAGTDVQTGKYDPVMTSLVKHFA
ncbi:hypothetical protein HDU83_002366, partial [Entophlyctis luteolus]